MFGVTSGSERRKVQSGWRREAEPTDREVVSREWTGSTGRNCHRVLKECKYVCIYVQRSPFMCKPFLKGGPNRILAFLH